MVLLPCYTRIDIDRQQSGLPLMNCENSMGVVRMSKGVLEPLPG